MKHCLSCLLALFVSALSALELNVGKNEFTVQTKRLSATVRDGIIVELRDLPRGIVWCDPKFSDPGIPAGLGVLIDTPNLCKLHMPWGEPTLNQQLNLNTPLLNYFRPNSESKFSVRKNGTKVLSVWKGLSNGSKTLKDAELRFEFGEAPDGALTVRTAGMNPAKGLFGIPFALTNIPNDSKFIFANFGGMEYDGKGVPGLMPFGGSPFAEAPLMILQKKGVSLALWMEDPTIRPFYLFFRRSGKSVSIAMENLALMPFENNAEFLSPELKLDVFQGDWKTAATPYRNWYRECFKNELAVRDAVKWADGIKAIVDIYMAIPDDKALATAAKGVDPSRVMFQIWNARAPAFDTELPDWTPRKGYVEGVARLHKSGFKAMAYVNTYCANYQSPVWKRDNLSDIFLTRKNSIGYYKGGSVADTSAAINEKLIGTVDYSAAGEDQFKDMPAGRLLYSDPLSKKWREYHARMMKEWNSTTKTDANYEDTAGCVGDSGNGTVDGLSAGEGSIAAMRELQNIQPQVPMSSEYGPSGIAFATKFALNYAGFWGYDGFKQYRIFHQHPVNTYLFGYRQWVCGLNTDRPLLAHACAAVSDATGGLGFAGQSALTSPDVMSKNWTFQRHLLERSKVFIEKDLFPYFPEGDYPESVRCMYRGKDGVYSYLDSDGYQRLLDPKGKALYGRVFGANKVETELRLPSWPLQNDKSVFGLDPEKNYALFRKDQNPPEARIRIATLPDKVFAKKYIETPDGVLLELAALPGGPDKVSFALAHDAGLTDFYVNDRKADPAKIEGTLPLRLTAFKAPTPRPYGTPVASTGVVAERFRTVEFFRQNNGARHFPVKVNAREDALSIFFRNLQTQYPWHGHDGTILRVLVNGKEVASFDSLISVPAAKGDPKAAKFKPDDLVRRWIIPVGEYAGSDILVTVETDIKTNGNWDNQLVSVPVTVKSPDQKFSLKTFDGSFRVIRNLYKENKWFGGKLIESPEGKTIEGKGLRASGPPMKVDPSKTYRLSGKFKVPAKEDGWLCFGLICYDAKGVQILPFEVNPVPGTFTKLAAPAKEGDLTLTLENGQGWKSLPLHYAALNAKEDAGDLPNREVFPVKAVEGNVVTLAAPLKKAYPAGTALRQHASGNTHNYTAASYKNVPAGVWTEFAGEVSGEMRGGLNNGSFRAGTDSCAVFLLTTQKNVMFKNIALEEIE